jgi:hypothetical protein
MCIYVHRINRRIWTRRGQGNPSYSDTREFLTHSKMDGVRTCMHETRHAPDDADMHEAAASRRSQNSLPPILAGENTGLFSLSLSL